MDWKQTWGEGLGSAGWRETQHDPVMCTCSPEGQPYPALCQKKCSQQVNGGDSAPLLCSGETPPRVRCPLLKTSAQERPVGAVPEEGHKNDQRAVVPFLWGKAEWVGPDQPGEKKTSGTPYSSFPVPEVGLQEGWRGTF